MALREEQIVRYSRQILLREVGGRGQESLLATAVQLDAGDAAGLTAAAYLAAAGAPLRPSERPLTAQAPGFLASASDVGAPEAAVLARELPGFNADALGGAPGASAPAAQLAELPATFSAPGPWVGLGARGGQGAVLFRAAEACVHCFETAAATLEAPPTAALGSALGALGALVLQRLVLGLGPASGLLLLEAPGALVHAPPPRCARCA